MGFNINTDLLTLLRSVYMKSCIGLMTIFSSFSMVRSQAAAEVIELERLIRKERGQSKQSSFKKVPRPDKFMYEGSFIEELQLRLASESTGVLCFALIVMLVVIEFSRHVWAALIVYSVVAVFFMAFRLETYRVLIQEVGRAIGKEVFSIEVMFRPKKTKVIFWVSVEMITTIAGMLGYCNSIPGNRVLLYVILFAIPIICRLLCFDEARNRARRCKHVDFRVDIGYKVKIGFNDSNQDSIVDYLEGEELLFTEDLYVHKYKYDVFVVGYTTDIKYINVYDMKGRLCHAYKPNDTEFLVDRYHK